MSRLRPLHFGLAFLLALALHLAALFYAVGAASGAAADRGGGLTETGSAARWGERGVVVQLGADSAAAPAEPPPPQQPPQPPPPSVEKTAEAAPVEAPAADLPDVPVAEIAPEPVPEPVAEPDAVAVLPAPIPKPAPPAAAAPVQGPAKAGPAAPPKPPVRAPAKELPPQVAAAPAPVPEPAPAEIATPQTVITFGGEASRLGTASGNAEGERRALTYGDRVMLWLQQHGEYPLAAARYRIRDTVRVEFTIDRNGRILRYRLVEESRWIWLNMAVRQMMDASSPVPPFPPGMAESEKTFNIPVRFTPP